MKVSRDNKSQFYRDTRKQGCIKLKEASSSSVYFRGKFLANLFTVTEKNEE